MMSNIVYNASATKAMSASINLFWAIRDQLLLSLKP